MRWAVLAAALVAAPAGAWAWTEARPISAEAHGVAQEDGTAEISYRVVFAIDAGWFRGFTLAGLPTGTTIDPTRSRAIDEQGAVYALDIKSGTGDRRGAFWIDLATSHGVGRGQLVVELVWTGPLRVTHVDGATVWEWETPPWSNGMNGVTASLDLPFPKERVEVVREGPASEDATAEMEAAQGSLDTSAIEAIDEQHCRVAMSTFRLPRWTSLRMRVRVAAPVAATATASPATRGPGQRARAPGQRRALIWIGAAVAIALLLALGKRHSTRSVARSAGAVALDAVLPRVGRVSRFVLAAGLLTGGLALQLPPIGQWTAGLACVLAAMALLARRFERAILARPPGHWVALGPDAARERLALGRRRFATLGSVFDATCGRGLFVLAIAAGGVVWSAHHLRPAMGWLAWVFALDALAVLAPLWLGATRRHLPPDLGTASARMLLRHGRRAKRLLRKCGGGEFSILGRYTGERCEDGGSRGAAPPEVYDELRLELVPARRPEGLVAVELGVEVWCRTPRLAAIVRTVTGSPAERLCRELRGVVERHRAPDGATTAVVLVPGPDGHASLFRDLRRALRALAKAAPPAPTAPAPEATEREAA